ncbi:MAG: Mur ligase family protein [Erysipelotrichia bacterium]|nr:Mur ligase family protein [Erysipelotrichia bacterium]NCC53950.1 Mur ligase family protein [Erysipelotrichia bacterium]
MRVRVTILIMKMIRYILVKMGRGGSLPGKIALRMCPNILNAITYPNKVVMVTGTNGKTTTSNMIYEVLSKQYPHVIANRKGDNLLEGITTLVLANTKMNLVLNADAMVIEVDELNVPKVLPKVKVSDFIVNNFFRDQLDRAGEMETIVVKMEEAIKQFEGNLILNGDDPNVARLGYHREHVYYFGVDKNEMSQASTNEASEGKFCFHCNHELVYDYYQYSHIGRFHCPHCSFGSHSYLVLANDVSLLTSTFCVEGMTFHAPQDALFSIYNCMALIALAKISHIDFDKVQSVLSTFELKDGRMENFHIGRDCLLNLVKNPTGANETMKYIERDLEAKDIVIILNDNDQDGKDVSWIWDANFDLIMGDDVKNIICSGLRAYDMALRLKYTAYQGNIIVEESMDQAIQTLKKLPNHAYVIATYTALQPVRAILRRYEQ